jgi:hypothetical protein
MGNLPIFWSTLPSLAKEYGLEKNQFYTISFLRNETTVYHGKFEAHPISKFVQISQHGHLIKFNGAKFAEILREKIPILCLFSDREDRRLEHWVDDLRFGYQSHMIAMKLEDRTNPEEEMIWQFCEVTEQDRGVCVIEAGQNLIKYLFKKRLNQANLNKFIERYLAGKLKPSVKIESIGQQFTGEIMVNKFIRRFLEFEQSDFRGVVEPRHRSVQVGLLLQGQLWEV